MKNNIHSLEARYYTDADLYEKERDRIMSRSWVFAGHSAQLKNAGDYFTFEVAGESLFCVRDNNGDIRTFYNVCQHRAHQIVTGAGNVRRLLVCPYHGWAYDLSGKLQSGPKIPSLDLSDIRLHSVHTENFAGFLFVNLDDDAKPMEDWFPNAQKELREFVPHIDDLAPLQWVEIPEQCNWKVSVENHSECYHCSRNHRAFATGIIKSQSYDIQPQGYCLRHTTECQNLDKMSYPIDLNANPYAGSYSTWLLWPAFAFQVYPGNILNTYHWRPHGVDRVTVWRGWYSIGGEESEVIRDLAKQDRETTVEEDIHLVESVQRGLQSRGYRPGPLVINPTGGVNSEHSIRVMQQWTRAALN